VILAVCGDKGAPGATTVATLLALCWPARTVLTEVDLRGCDLPLRLHTPTGPIQERPSFAAFAVDARPGMPVPPPDRYTQETTLGVALMPGEVTVRSNHGLAPHLTAAASAAAGWSGLLVADLGLAAATNPAMAFARQAVLTMFVTRADVNALARLADQVEMLADLTGDAARARVPVAVVLSAEASDRTAAIARASTVLQAVGSPVPVIGAVPYDRKGIASLWAAFPGPKLAKSVLCRAGMEVVSALVAGWPDLITPDGAATVGAGHAGPDLLEWPALSRPGSS